MKVGIPREVKNNEFRVAITPAGVNELVRHGHQVFVEKDAGLGSSITNEEYVSAGATILGTADEVWGTADLLLKVKEPIAEEYHRLRKDQTLFTYLHLAASRSARTRCWSPAPPPSPTRPSRRPAASCRCSPRCPRSRAVSPRRSAPTT